MTWATASIIQYPTPTMRTPSKILSIPTDFRLTSSFSNESRARVGSLRGELIESTADLTAHRAKSAENLILSSVEALLQFSCSCSCSCLSDSRHGDAVRLIVRSTSRSSLRDNPESNLDHIASSAYIHTDIGHTPSLSPLWSTCPRPSATWQRPF